MRVRYEVLAVVLFTIYIVSLSVIIHEAVHADQCFERGGKPSFIFYRSDGYDFLKTPWDSALPSPATFCSIGYDASKGDWCYEGPAFFWSGLFIALFSVWFGKILSKI